MASRARKILGHVFVASVVLGWIALELRRSDPAGAFDEVAMAAVAQWRYCPLGEPKESAVRLVFEPDAPTAEASPCANLEGPFATRLCRWLESTR